jgi:hypothetical protein
LLKYIPLKLVLHVSLVYLLSPTVKVFCVCACGKGVPVVRLSVKITYWVKSYPLILQWKVSEISRVKTGLIELKERGRIFPH